MIPILVITISVLLGLAVVGTIILLWELVPWHPQAKLAAKRGAYINMPRKPRERLSVYERRVDDGWCELLDAGDEFLAAAMREGICIQKSEHCFEWQLPADHPAAIRYAKAKGIYAKDSDQS